MSIEAQNLQAVGTVVGRTGYRCNGAHRYFVAEVVGVESEGIVHLLAMCTDCGDTLQKTFPVSNKAGSLTFKNTKD